MMPTFRSMAWLVLLVGCGHRDPASPVPVRESPAVADLVASHPDATLARPGENGSRLLARMREEEPGYDPYVLRGDLTHDGRPDLVVVLREGEAWSVYWMRGTKDGYAEPLPLGDHQLLAEGGLFIKDGDLGIGRFYSDVATWYRWSPGTRRLEPHDISLP